MKNASLHNRSCPVCHSSKEGPVFVDQNIKAEELTKFAFASRKIPEFFSHRLIRCPDCTVIYAPAVPSNQFLKEAYLEADFDSGDEAQCAAASYGKALERHIAKLRHRGSALEIGTGTGAFLPYLQKWGFSSVIGIEPSIAAIENAHPKIKPLIQMGIFEPKKFKPNSFSFICCFQTLEHVLEPKELVQSCLFLLEPGGMLALVTHDHSAWLNKLLGRRSPIVDIEHLQIFSPQNMELLLKTSGFEEIAIHSIQNSYRLQYWLRLTPIPRTLKNFCFRLAKWSHLGRIKLGVNVGNMLAVGRKP